MLAVLARVVARLVLRTNGVEGGYDFYFQIVDTFTHGGGLCVAPGHGCALRMPLYPVFLWMFSTGSAISWTAIVLQAMAGAATAYIALRLGEELVGNRAAWIAAIAVAVSPFEVVHDTALQDTVFIDFFMLAGVWGLVRMRRTAGYGAGLLAGASFGLAVLTSARVALVVCALLLSVAVWAAGAGSVRIKAALCTIGLCAALVGGWLVRNYFVVDSLVLTSESGVSLWAANGPWTMRRLPDQSIDLVVHDAIATLTPDQRDQVLRLEGKDVALDRWYRSLAWTNVLAHPGTVLRGALVKAAVPVVGYLSPARSGLVQVGYAIIYLPIHCLAAVALWRLRRIQPHPVVPVVTVFAFLLTSGVYWAHTSHAALLDPIWFIYGAAGLGGSRADRDAKI